MASQILQLCLSGQYIKNVFVYLNDIIMFPKSVDEYFQLLDEILCRLSMARLKIQLRENKPVFNETVRYLWACY